MVLLSVVLLAWLLPWALLTGAAAVSGTHPVTSPFDFINPVRLVTLYRADGNAEHVIPFADAEPDARLVWAQNGLDLGVVLAPLTMGRTRLATRLRHRSRPTPQPGC